MKYSFFLAFIFSFIFISSTIAQGDAQTREKSEENVELSNETDSEIQYIPATHANMSALLWKYRAYELDNKAILSNYVKSQNCFLYEQNVNDEFVWNNILEGVKRDIQYTANKVSDRLEILAIIPLGRYNFNDLAMEIRSDYALYNEGAIIAPFQSYQTLGCVMYYSSEHFPQIIKFLPDNRYLLTEIPMHPEQAEPLLERIQSNPIAGYPIGSRILLARIRIKVHNVQELNDTQIIFGGQLDEIAFFEDEQMTKEVWRKSFKDLE